MGKVAFEAQFGSCTFMTKRSQKYEKLEMSFAQRNKWDKDWSHYWFYVKTSNVNTRDKFRNKVVRYPLASTMEDMRPLTRLTADVDKAREACDVAFGAACRYSGGVILWRKWWLLDSGCLGRKKGSKMTLEKVKLPVFGEAEGVLFPCFGLKLAEGESGADVVAQVEATTSEILGDISEREYLAQ